MRETHQIAVVARRIDDDEIVGVLDRVDRGGEFVELAPPRCPTTSAPSLARDAVMRRQFEIEPGVLGPGAAVLDVMGEAFLTRSRDRSWRRAAQPSATRPRYASRRSIYPTHPSRCREQRRRLSVAARYPQPTWHSSRGQSSARPRLRSRLTRVFDRLRINLNHAAKNRNPQRQSAAQPQVIRAIAPIARMAFARARARARPSRWCRPWARCTPAIWRWCAWPSAAPTASWFRSSSIRRSSRRTRISRAIRAPGTPTSRRCRSWRSMRSGRRASPRCIRTALPPRSRRAAPPWPALRTSSARIFSAASAPWWPSFCSRLRRTSRCSARRTTSSSRS